jgi:hypothetical protein
MPRNTGYTRNIPAHLKQPTNTIMAKVMEMQVFDLKELAGTGKGSRN